MLLYKWPREAHYLEGQEGKQGRGRAEEGHDTSRQGKAREAAAEERRRRPEPDQTQRGEGGSRRTGGGTADGGQQTADGRTDGRTDGRHPWGRPVPNEQRPRVGGTFPEESAPVTPARVRHPAPPQPNSKRRNANPRRTAKEHKHCHGRGQPEPGTPQRAPNPRHSGSFRHCQLAAHCCTAATQAS